MSVKLNELMERTGEVRLGFAVSYIKDAFKEMGLDNFGIEVTQKQDIIADRVKYPLPAGLIRLAGISVLYSGDETELLDTYDRTFGGTTNWTNGDFDSFGTGSDLSVANGTADQYCYLDDDDHLTENHRYRLRYKATISGGTFDLYTNTGNIKLGRFAQGTDQHIEFTSPETGEMKIVGISGSGTADFDDFSLVELAQQKWRGANRIIGHVPNDFFDDETAPNRE